MLLAIAAYLITNRTWASAGSCTVVRDHWRTHPVAETRSRLHPRALPAAVQHSARNDGLASLLRVNNNSTHHGVDAAAAHAFSRVQAQHREEASETVDGDDAHDSTVVKN